MCVCGRGGGRVEERKRVCVGVLVCRRVSVCMGRGAGANMHPSLRASAMPSPHSLGSRPFSCVVGLCENERRGQRTTAPVDTSPLGPPTPLVVLQALCPSPSAPALATTAAACTLCLSLLPAFVLLCVLRSHTPPVSAGSLPAHRCLLSSEHGHQPL